MWSKDGCGRMKKILKTALIYWLNILLIIIGLLMIGILPIIFTCHFGIKTWTIIVDGLYVTFWVSLLAAGTENDAEDKK